MKRRAVMRRAATIGLASVAGCTSDSAPNESKGERNRCANATAAGPGSLYDSLTLQQVPEYVTEYSGSIIVQYDDLGASSKKAVEQALSADGAYEECVRGKDRTRIKSLAAHIERRWDERGRDAYHRTYLQYQGSYYGISLVEEGDFVRVNSISCTDEECPATPTPPP